jgi:PAS domain S-box-containing protein
VVEKERQYARNLTFLARTTTKLVELSPDEDVYQFIGEELREFIGNSVVLVSSFEKASKRVCVRAVSGIEKYMGSILKILGRVPAMMSFTIKDEIWPDITSGQLVKISGGLNELTFGETPETVCHAIEKLLNLGDIYGMGFMKGGKLFGATVIMMRKGNVLRNQSIVETFINQASVVLQRKWAEEALRIAETNFRNVIEKNADAIFVVDKEGIVRFVNPAAEVAFECRKDKLVGKTFGFTVVPGETTEIDIARNGMESLTAEMRVVEAKWEGQNVYVASLRDITKRKRVEEVIEKAKKDWEDSFDSINDMITIHDKDFNILRINKAAQQIFKSPFKELVNEKCYKVYHGKDCPPEKCPHHQCLQTGKPMTIEGFESHLNRFLEIKIMPRFDEDNNIIGIVHVARDITERKLLEEQLIQSEKLAAMGELVSGVAHEMRNPLTGVVGLAQFLKEEASGLDKKRREQLELIYSEAMRIEKIVSNLLSFARKSKPEKVAVSINKILKSVLEIRGYDLRVNNIDVIEDFDEQIPSVEADSQQLQQVFLNIINNAQQAMTEAHDKGTLTIRIYVKGQMVRVEFTDDGPGISKESLKKIFDPFFTTKEVGKGTGLGLSVSYGIVKEHGGGIFAESKKEKGAKFTVEFPVMKE